MVHYVNGFRAKRNKLNSILKLQENRCYKGVRHSYFLSVRGQKTRTNAKTQRNKKNKKKKKTGKKKNKWKNFFFKIEFLYQIYILYKIKILNYIKFWFFIKKYIYFLNFIFLCISTKYKIFVYSFYKKQKFYVLEKTKIIKKYIQKGYKFQNLGIYKKNLYNIDNYNIKNKNKFLFLIRFKRKNLFLTLLNKDGNVLCKTNIGSCGFKKKVKYTGYAIKQTSKKFLEKILKHLIYKLYNTYYIVSLKKKKKQKKKSNSIYI